MTPETNEGTEAHLKVLVKGRTQGVGFRAFVVDRARKLGLTGYTRNLPDGTTVEVVAEGPRTNLDVLLTELRRGPSMSRVDLVETTWSDLTRTFTTFEVRYS